MLQLSAQQSRVTRAVHSRRHFLQQSAIALGGLSLVDLLRLRAEARAPRAKSVIMVLLRGGPSHIDMYDLKPDAPAQIRGEFLPIATQTPGMEICELMPRQAQISDKLAIIRSLQFTGDNHSEEELTTGWRYEAKKRPSYGAVASLLKGAGSHLPSHVVLSKPMGAGLVYRDEFASLYAGPAHRAFSPTGEISEDLSLLTELSQDRLRDRKQLLQDFDVLRRDLDASGNVAAMDRYTEQAFELIASNATRDALDVGLEPQHMREKYGISGRNAASAARWLQARRLVEAGVPVVNFAAVNGQEDWDTHAQNFKSLRQMLPPLDQGLAALVSDLQDRGLDKDVAVVVWGEMGPTPRVSDERAGRDHWKTAGFAVMAGGGWQTGQVIGKTNAWAEVPLTAPYRPQNVLASIFRHLGIDPATQLVDYQGRPHPLLDDCDPIAELT